MSIDSFPVFKYKFGSNVGREVTLKLQKVAKILGISQNCASKIKDANSFFTLLETASIISKNDVSALRQVLPLVQMDDYLSYVKQYEGFFLKKDFKFNFKILKLDWLQKNNNLDGKNEKNCKIL